MELEGPEVLGVKDLVCRAEEEASGLGKGKPSPAFEESVGIQTARGSLLATMWRVGCWSWCPEARRPVGPKPELSVVVATYLASRACH